MAFGRPKTYPHIHDAKAFLFDPAADADALASFETNPSPNEQAWLVRHRDGLIAGGARYFVKAPAKFTDPRCLYHVLDVVIKSKQNSYIRPREVSHWLNQTQSQYLWGTGTVGRLLAGMAEFVGNQYGVGAPDGVEYEENMRYMPFSGARDTTGAYYVIDPLGGNEGRLYLMRCRAVMNDIAAQQQRADQRGDSKAMFAMERNANDAAFNWLSSVMPIRTVEGYQAQIKAIGDPSLDTAPLEDLPDFANTPNDGSGVRVGA